MSNSTEISWTDAPWNPITGCTKISAGCQNCYAEKMAKRLQAMGQPNYANGFGLAMHQHVLDLPLRWRKPRKVFVCSMSDLFHNTVTNDFIHSVFEIMNRCPQHTFQILTKRSARLSDLAPDLNWTPNIWAGVTVENADWLHRIEDLRDVPAAVRFVSFEPLLSDVGAIDLSDIHWGIVGGESCPKSRIVCVEWIRNIRDQCIGNDIAFHFKQWGGVNKKRLVVCLMAVNGCNGRKLLDSLW
jgi:protein gp37